MLDKFIIYKGTGGLAHMLRGLNEAVKKAKISNRYLIIDSRSNPGFGCDFSDFFYIDNLPCSDRFRDIPVHYKFRNLTIRDIKKRSIHSSKKTYKIFQHDITDIDPNCDDELIVFAGTGSNKLVPGLKIQKIIMDKLLNESPINEPYISVHFRNTDLKNSLTKFISSIKKLMEKTNIKTIYWASDDVNSYNKIVKALNNAKIIRYSVPEKTETNLHSEAKDKYKQVYDCLKDIFFILKSDYFIPSKNSGMSKYIELMIKDENMFSINSKTILVS